MGCCNGDTIDLVQWDTLPALDLVLYDPSTNTPFDVSPANLQVYFLIRPTGAKQPLKESILCQKLPGLVDASGNVTYPPGYSVAGSGGRVEVHWDAGATDTAGQFDGTVQIQDISGGGQQTSVMTIRMNIVAGWPGTQPPVTP